MTGDKKLADKLTESLNEALAHEKGEKKLKTTTVDDSELKKDKDVITTQVTSLADEEIRTGKKIELPDADTLYQKALVGFISGRQQLGNLMPKLSKKAQNRVILAVLDLPMDGVPVLLKSDIEKICYAIGQRIQTYKYTILHHHVVQKQQEIKALNEKLKKEEKQKESKTTEKGEEKDGK